MTGSKALDSAARMGGRAGQSWLDTGIWPRCPFRGDSATEVALAAAWTDAVFATIRSARKAG